MNVNYITREPSPQQRAITTSQSVRTDMVESPLYDSSSMTQTSIPQTSQATNIRPTSDNPEHSNRGINRDTQGRTTNSMNNHGDETRVKEEDFKRLQETSIKSRIRAIPRKELVYIHNELVHAIRADPRTAAPLWSVTDDIWDELHRDLTS